jgi:hypothetical protein
MDLLPFPCPVRIGTGRGCFLVLLEYQTRILVIIDVVHAQVPDSFPASMLPVEVEAQIQIVAGRKSVIVPGSDEVLEAQVAGG